MKENKKQRKRTGRRGVFNLVDFLLILILLVFIVGAVLVYFPGIALGRKNSTAKITYVLEFEGVQPALASSIREGDAVTSLGGYAIGTVAPGIAVENHTVISYDPDTGDVVKSVHPSLKNIVVTVTADAKSDPVKGYTAGGMRIAAGASYRIVMPGFEGDAVCVSVTAEGGAY